MSDIKKFMLLAVLVVNCCLVPFNLFSEPTIVEPESLSMKSARYVALALLASGALGYTIPEIILNLKRRAHIRTLSNEPTTEQEKRLQLMRIQKISQWLLAAGAALGGGVFVKKLYDQTQEGRATDEKAREVVQMAKRAASDQLLLEEDALRDAVAQYPQLLERPLLNNEYKKLSEEGKNQYLLAIKARRDSEIAALVRKGYKKGEHPEKYGPIDLKYSKVLLKSLVSEDDFARKTPRAIVNLVNLVLSPDKNGNDPVKAELFKFYNPASKLIVEEMGAERTKVKNLVKELAKKYLDLSSNKKTLGTKSPGQGNFRSEIIRTLLGDTVKQDSISAEDVARAQEEYKKLSFYAALPNTSPSEVRKMIEEFDSVLDVKNESSGPVRNFQPLQQEKGVEELKYEELYRALSDPQFDNGDSDDDRKKEVKRLHLALDLIGEYLDIKEGTVREYLEAVNRLYDSNKGKEPVKTESERYMKGADPKAKIWMYHASLKARSILKKLGEGQPKNSPLDEKYSAQQPKTPTFLGLREEDVLTRLNAVLGRYEIKNSTYRSTNQNDSDKADLTEVFKNEDIENVSTLLPLFDEFKVFVDQLKDSSGEKTPEEQALFKKFGNMKTVRDYLTNIALLHNNYPLAKGASYAFQNRMRYIVENLSPDMSKLTVEAIRTVKEKIDAKRIQMREEWKNKAGHKAHEEDMAKWVLDTTKDLESKKKIQEAREAAQKASQEDKPAEQKIDDKAGIGLSDLGVENLLRERKEKIDPERMKKLEIIDAWRMEKGDDHKTHGDYMAEWVLATTKDSESKEKIQEAREAAQKASQEAKPKEK